MTENYVQIMVESLERKKDTLDAIIEKSRQQAEILKADGFFVEEFDRNVEEKAKLIEKLNMLDVGFDRMYAHVKEIFSTEEGKAKHRQEILKMQQLIAEITDRSVLIQTQENRNKQMVEQVFKKEKEKIRSMKKSSKAAIGYYRNMSNTSFVKPQFLDEKN